MNTQEFNLDVYELLECVEELMYDESIELLLRELNLEEFLDEREDF